LTNYVQNKKPKTAVERNIEKLLNSNLPLQDKFPDLDEIAQIYEELDNKLKEGPLTE
jgi:hypothetical protein